MKRIVAAVAAAALLVSATPALAGGYGFKHHGYSYGHKFHGYGGHYRYGRHYGYRRHTGHFHGHGHGHGGYVVGALIGGIVLGHLLSQPAYRPAYAAPPRPVLGNCQATTGLGYRDGRPAQFGGTMCFDQYGRGYVTPGSEYFIGYLR